MMDWKREAIDKLKCYEAKKTSIDRTAEEIRRLEDDTTRIRSAVTDSTPVSGGTSTREDMLVNNIARREELHLARKDAVRWVKLVDGALGVLDEEEKLLLDRFYIHRAQGNIDRLCGELCLEKTRVYERKDAALRHFTLALYGVVET
ncbi:MAG: hypothetical protein RRY65_01250 [Pseudoflavonifractor sp.]